MATLQSISVRGSAGDIYTITAETAPKARLSCTCIAGQNRRWCRHREEILAGDLDALETGTEADVAALQAFAVDVGLFEAIEQVMLIEGDQLTLAQKLKKARTALNRWT